MHDRSEHAYRYATASTYHPGTGLALATSGGSSAHPHFLRACVAAPDQAARALLAVAEVARTRYFDPGASARSRDPVVTSNASVGRWPSSGQPGWPDPDGPPHGSSR